MGAIAERSSSNRQNKAFDASGGERQKGANNPRFLDGRRAIQPHIPCMVLRGGTSKGAYFLADDLPSDPAARDALILSIMGSPDPRQIDGIGGAHPSPARSRSSRDRDGRAATSISCSGRS